LTILYWLFAGAGIGILHGMTLWWTVSALQPAKIGRALTLVWGGALLRCVTVAALLIVAMNHALSSGLLAAAGFFLARWVLSAMIGLRMANTKRALSR